MCPPVYLSQPPCLCMFINGTVPDIRCELCAMARPAAEASSVVDPCYPPPHFMPPTHTGTTRGPATLIQQSAQYHRITCLTFDLIEHGCVAAQARHTRDQQAAWSLWQWCLRHAACAAAHCAHNSSHCAPPWKPHHRVCGHGERRRKDAACRMTLHAGSRISCMHMAPSLPALYVGG